MTEPTQSPWTEERHADARLRCSPGQSADKVVLLAEGAYVKRVLSEALDEIERLGAELAEVQAAEKTLDVAVSVLSRASDRDVITRCAFCEEHIYKGLNKDAASQREQQAAVVAHMEVCREHPLAKARARVTELDVEVSNQRERAGYFRGVVIGAFQEGASAGKDGGEVSWQTSRSRAALERGGQ